MSTARVTLRRMMRGRVYFSSAMIASMMVSFDPSTASSLSSNNVGASSLEMFQQSWQTYKSVVNADLMEHASLTRKISEVVHEWIDHTSNSDKARTDLSVADLGCGDLALLGPLYSSLPLTAFHGVDMSLPALKLAQEAFQIASENSDFDSHGRYLSVSWKNEDLLQWARGIEAEYGADGSAVNVAETQQKFDIIICAFSAHHLNDQDKIRFLQALKSNRLKTNGMILMADIFRIEEEDRDSYITRFGNHIETTWNSISKPDLVAVLKHVRENDYPASLQDFITSMSPACDLSCEVVWGDTGNFEKLVVLKAL